MDYKELANLVFPNIKDTSYYEEKYPKRDLKEGAMVVRFAPSPTGFVHIGGIFTSVICSKLAKQTDGVFILRVEDTDQKREVENRSYRDNRCFKKVQLRTRWRYDRWKHF